MTMTVTAPAGAVTFVRDDGGRAAAGYRGTVGDCACRAVAIASGRPYREVYDLINAYGARERKSSRKRSQSSARTGVYSATLDRLVTREYGAVWTPTMRIGSGTTVHVRTDELPTTGRHVLRLSKHYAAYVDGVLRDTHDPSREGTRAVYGFWTFPD